MPGVNMVAFEHLFMRHCPRVDDRRILRALFSFLVILESQGALQLHPRTVLVHPTWVSQVDSVWKQEPSTSHMSLSKTRLWST